MTEWTEAERLIVEYTKAHDADKVRYASHQPLLDLGRKLIEAERPKLLDKHEAALIYLATSGNPTNFIAHDGMQAVLTEERKRTLKVIEAHIKGATVRRHADDCTMRAGDHPDYCSCGGLIAFADIQSALQPKS